jgi:phospholipid/cholesterol/gamma-HCH transport system permease protein
MSTRSIPCPRDINRSTGRTLFYSVRDSGFEPGDVLVLNLGDSESLDTNGGAWLMEIAEFVRTADGEFRWEGHSGQVAEFLDLIEPGLVGSGRIGRSKDPFFDRFTDAAVRVGHEARDMGGLVADAVYWMLVGPIFDRRRFRWGLLLDELFEMGWRAVPICCTMNLLLGLTIAMLSAAQARNVGLDLFVADLVMIGFARELAALMTAIVVAARSGAAIAAELATMEVQEEIDALRGMGLNVPQFLVAPKLLAMSLALPLLVGLGMIFGVLGGALWGILVMGFTPDVWFEETLKAADFGDIFQGFLKAFFFGVTIVFIGCHNGLRVQGGSRGVGLMTTRAVVMDIFMIIVIDMVFAAIFYYVMKTGP